MNTADISEKEFYNRIKWILLRELTEKEIAYINTYYIKRSALTPEDIAEIVLSTERIAKRMLSP